MVWTGHRSKPPLPICCSYNCHPPILEMVLGLYESAVLGLRRWPHCPWDRVVLFQGPLREALRENALLHAQPYIVAWHQVKPQFMGSAAQHPQGFPGLHHIPYLPVSNLCHRDPRADSPESRVRSPHSGSFTESQLPSSIQTSQRSWADNTAGRVSGV